MGWGKRKGSFVTYMLTGLQVFSEYKLSQKASVILGADAFLTLPPYECGSRAHENVVSRDTTPLGDRSREGRPSSKLAVRGGGASAHLQISKRADGVKSKAEMKKSGITIGRKRKTCNGVPWEDRYEELKQVYTEYGHCNVPQKEGPLGLFVAEQRSEYKKMSNGKKSSMTLEKVKLLNKIDFIWDKNEYTWEKSFEELCLFKSKHGHCNVPRSYGSLGLFVQKQRSEFKKMKRGEKSLMTQGRFERLQEIDFIWDALDWMFKVKLEELRRYKERYGHINVRAREGELGEWVYSRRKQYKKWLKGEPTALNQEQVAALEDLGFCPAMFETRNTFKYESKTWDQRFEELRKYKLTHGTCNIPKSYNGLGEWVCTQRYKKTKEKRGERTTLTKAQEAKLDSIGFVWDVPDWMWNEKFKELKEFRQIHGHTNVPLREGELGEWVKNQRGCDWQAWPDREERLNSIGFDFHRWDHILTGRDVISRVKRWKETDEDRDKPSASVILAKLVTTQRKPD